MKKIIFFFSLLMHSGSFVFAQSFCANDDLENYIYKKNPQYYIQKSKATSEWLEYNRLMKTSKMIVAGTDTSYEIPVVVHIVHTGGAIGSAFNPTNSEIIDFIDFLNKAWEATWPTFADVTTGGTKIPIKFVLAKRDPNCNATNGIQRVNGSVLPGYSVNGVCPFGFEVGPSDLEMKSLSVWPPADYYNIWLVNEIEGGGVNGYAPWPWYNEPSLIDGAVIDIKYSRKTAGDYSYTVAHEVGHSFGLYHTFQDGCDGSSSCLTAGDELCDTEPHSFSGAFECPIGLTNSCTGTMYNGVEYNFMNYTNCPTRFTGDQRKRILYTLRKYRSGLITSLGVNPPDASFSAPLPACKPAIVNTGSVTNIGPCKISFSNLNAFSLGYFMDAYTSYIDRTCSQEIAIVNMGKTYNLSISTISAPQEVAAWIDYNNDGIFQSSERIYSHSGLFIDEVHSAGVTIPFAGVISNKILRMRVKSDIVPITDACSDVSDGQTEDFSVLVLPSTGINVLQSEVEKLLVFPNPAIDKLHIQTEPDCLLSLFSIDGRKLWSGVNVGELDIHNLHSGIYFLEARRNSDGIKIGIQKVVISAK